MIISHNWPLGAIIKSAKSFVSLSTVVKVRDSEVFSFFMHDIIPVYNDVEDAFYIHHDLLLPSFPLALEWLNFEPGDKARGEHDVHGCQSEFSQGGTVF